MYRPPLDANGNVLFVHDARWMVPPDYYDEWRSWYGWVHRNTTWTCLTRGELLVIGPAKKGEQRLSGTLCLYDAIESRKKSRCAVYSQWGIEEIVSVYRLVPVELCRPITDIRHVWLAKHRLLEVT